MGYTTFEEIPVWRDSHQLTIAIYKLTKKFPKEEKYGLISQIRRSSASIPANIAEGFYKNTTKELVLYLYNSRASSGESIHHIILAKDLGYISENEYQKVRANIENIAKQLNNWINSLKKKH